MMMMTIHVCIITWFKSFASKAPDSEYHRLRGSHTLLSCHFALWDSVLMSCLLGCDSECWWKEQMFLWYLMKTCITVSYLDLDTKHINISNTFLKFSLTNPQLLSAFIVTRYYFTVRINNKPHMDYSCSWSLSLLPHPLFHLSNLTSWGRQPPTSSSAMLELSFLLKRS